MYPFFLDLHNLLRWLVLAAGAAALVAAWAGVIAGGKWSPRLGGISRLFVIAIDLQVLVGLVLFVVLSPVTRAALRDLGAAMRSGEIRFIVVEHFVLMLAAAVLAHVGAARGKAKDSALQAATCYTLAALALAFGTPWGRRLLPWL